MIYSHIFFIAILGAHHALAVNFTKGLYFWGLNILPQAPILKFDTTLIVPPASKLPPYNGKDGNLAGIWAGLQPVPELLQQVIGNEGPAGQWSFVPFFCCQPGVRLQDLRMVHPGDSLTTLFRWNPQSQNWYDNWLLTIGEEGHTAGEVPMGGGLIVGPYDGLYAANSNTSKPYAMLMVETQQGQWWDWGTIYWKDVLIEAQTQATDWCTGDWSGNVENGWDKLIWNRTTPVATVDAVANTTTCYIASIVFIGHA